MSYNTEQEPIYKDLNKVARDRRNEEPIVIDFSRGTKDVTADKIREILEHLKLRSQE